MVKYKFTAKKGNKTVFVTTSKKSEAMESREFRKIKGYKVSSIRKVLF